MVKILIWGLGKRTQEYLADGYFSGCHIVGVCGFLCKMGIFIRVCSPADTSLHTIITIVFYRASRRRFASMSETWVVR